MKACNTEICDPIDCTFDDWAESRKIVLRSRFERVLFRVHFKDLFRAPKNCALGDCAQERCEKFMPC